MTENIQAIFIRDTETRQRPKPHTVFKVEVHAAVRTWVVWKRYSEFEKLHAQFLTVFPKHLPPVQLPVKHWIRSTFGDFDKTEERRRGLEDYLRGILSDRDDCWRQTDIWHDFLAIPSGRQLDANTMYTSESWLDEYKDMTNNAREIRSLINRRTAHIEQGEISSSHNCTMQAKKLLVMLTGRLSSLEAGLIGLAKGVNQGAMSEGELRRRQDMLTKLKDDKEALLKLINAGRQDLDMLYSNTNSASVNKNNSQDHTNSDRNSLLGNSNGNMSLVSASQGNGLSPTQPRKDMIRRGRAFGAAAKNAQAVETAETRELDDDGLVQYQQQLMVDQDSQLEQFSALLMRQKHIGLAIGDELETQNQMLDELDSDVDRTQTKLKFASKKLAKIK